MINLLKMSDFNKLSKEQKAEFIRDLNAESTKGMAFIYSGIIITLVVAILIGKFF